MYLYFGDVTLLFSFPKCPPGYIFTYFYHCTLRQQSLYKSIKMYLHACIYWIVSDEYKYEVDSVYALCLQVEQRAIFISSRLLWAADTNKYKKNTVPKITVSQTPVLILSSFIHSTGGIKTGLKKNYITL